MTVKLIMRWNIRQETESEYFEFLVHEFIPALSQLGVSDIQVWYTAYGECEQKLAQGIVPSPERMRTILNGDDWQNLAEKLQTFVNDFELKVVEATGGFQI